MPLLPPFSLLLPGLVGPRTLVTEVRGPPESNAGPGAKAFCEPFHSQFLTEELLKGRHGTSVTPSECLEQLPSLLLWSKNG